MNWLLVVLLLLLAGTAEAREVVATGYGTSVEFALENAKTLAIEQVAGTFVTGTTTVVEGAYRSRIEQHHGGFIRHYQVLDMGQTDGLISAKIKAEVATGKINTVHSDQGADISRDAAEQLAQTAYTIEPTARMVAALDDPLQALVVHIVKISYANRGPLTDVDIDAEITLNPKWYDDVKTMERTAGHRIDLGSAWADVLWGMAALSAIINPMLPGTLSHLARAAEKKPSASLEYATCFGTEASRDIDECYEIRQPLLALTRTQPLTIELMLVSGQREGVVGRWPVHIRNRLFVEVREGSRLYFINSAKERRFDHAGILLFERSMMPIKYSLTLPTVSLLEGDSFRMALQKAP